MLTKLPIWQQLQQHYQQLTKLSLHTEFQQHPERTNSLSFYFNDDFYVDLSKNLITSKTLALLINLAEQRQLKSQIDDLFSGRIVNQSEQQAALHIALRTIPAQHQIESSLQKMQYFSEKIRNHEYLGYNGKVITDVINLGTGGSYLGPYMTTQALQAYQDNDIKLHFFANQQDKILQRLLKKLNPETTLIIVSSKSFTTAETLHNFQLVLQWLTAFTDKSSALQQCIAITAQPDKAQTYGFTSQQIIPFLTNIGGRFSIWSAIGLPLCISIGFTQFKNFLAGASEMDQHFQHQAFEKNIPVLLALLDIGYINFFHASNLAILPYHQDLYLLPRYLQQLSMESLGKSVTQTGEPVNYATGNIIYGGVGSTGQHAYHQLLHQGNAFIRCEFVVTHEDAYLFMQCLAQSRALMLGEKNKEAAKNCPGNRPSTTLVLSQLTPKALGSLLALYEHRIFTQAAIWNINPFDQWGVEIGKKMGKSLEDIVKYHQLPPEYDASTLALLQHYYERLHHE